MENHDIQEAAARVPNPDEMWDKFRPKGKWVDAVDRGLKSQTTSHDLLHAAVREHFPRSVITMGVGGVLGGAKGYLDYRRDKRKANTPVIGRLKKKPSLIKSVAKGVGQGVLVSLPVASEFMHGDSLHAMKTIQKFAGNRDAWKGEADKLVGKAKSKMEKYAKKHPNIHDMPGKDRPTGKDFPYKQIGESTNFELGKSSAYGDSAELVDKSNYTPKQLRNRSIGIGLVAGAGTAASSIGTDALIGMAKGIKRKIKGESGPGIISSTLSGAAGGIKKGIKSGITWGVAAGTGAHIMGLERNEGNKAMAERLNSRMNAAFKNADEKNESAFENVLDQIVSGKSPAEVVQGLIQEAPGSPNAIERAHAWLSQPISGSSSRYTAGLKAGGLLAAGAVALKAKQAIGNSMKRNRAMKDYNRAMEYHRKYFAGAYGQQPMHAQAAAPTYHAYNSYGSTAGQQSTYPNIYQPQHQTNYPNYGY